jgi:hypothetical protein
MLSAIGPKDLSNLFTSDRRVLRSTILVTVQALRTECGALLVLSTTVVNYVNKIPRSK